MKKSPKLIDFFITLYGFSNETLRSFCQIRFFSSKVKVFEQKQTVLVCPVLKEKTKISFDRPVDFESPQLLLSISKIMFNSKTWLFMPKNFLQCRCFVAHCASQISRKAMWDFFRITFLVTPIASGGEAKNFYFLFFLQPKVIALKVSGFFSSVKIIANYFQWGDQFSSIMFFVWKIAPEIDSAGMPRRTFNCNFLKTQISFS